MSQSKHLSNLPTGLHFVLKYFPFTSITQFAYGEPRL